MATQYWTCDFGCGYHSESKNDVERHEGNCEDNPINTDEFEDDDSRGFNQSDNEG